jgi:hypothetical protein
VCVCDEIGKQKGIKYRVHVENEMNKMIATYAHVILHLFESRSWRVGGVGEIVREENRSRRRRETRKQREER